MTEQCMDLWEALRKLAPDADVDFLRERARVLG